MTRATAAASFHDGLDGLLEKAWPSYTLIALLQLKVIWKIWALRDLTTDDTSSYFLNGLRWAEDFAVNFVWSPLYTAFYGSVFALTGDIYAATTLHRVVVVMAATLGVLALMRRLLPPAVALLTAVWWAILPINFETPTEVHLFALLPVLAAWLAAATVDTPLARGTAVAMFLMGAVLVRNELVIAVILFGAICLMREMKECRRAEVGGGLSRRSRAARYGVPLLLSIGVCLFFYWRSDYKPRLAELAARKHTLNMCQVYAFGHSQRDPGWKSSPWVECHPLMAATFGKPEPTLLEMIRSNPRATLTHFLWNASLVPSGMQVALFNAMSGKVNPDYAPVRRRGTVRVLGAALILLVAGGTGVAVRRWNYWWPEWFRQRRGIWLALLPVLCVAVPVILTQRPRPSYLFAQTVIVMALVGSAVEVLTHRWPRASKVLAVTGALGAVLFVPSFYVRHPSDRPLYTKLQRLLPFGEVMHEQGSTIVLGDYSYELTNYLALARDRVKTFDYSILASRGAGENLNGFLTARGVDMIYLEPRLMSALERDPRDRLMVDRPEAVGWQRLGPDVSGSDVWLLLKKSPVPDIDGSAGGETRRQGRPSRDRHA